MNIRRWLFLSALLFAGGFVWGLSMPLDESGLLGEQAAALEDLASMLSPLSQHQLFSFILLKNVMAVLVSFVLSPFFYLMPIMALVLNGGVLGLVSTLVVEEKSLGFLLAGVLPHGIFEIPALIIGEAAAFSFGTAVMLAVFNKDRRKMVLPNLKQNSKYLTISFALLVAAAIIETYVTPLFLGV